jgi:hypothetical protein|tara:strand:- start:367 stop:585 length:219 start_codon:yes stop_codon:yes gene_type:complete
MSKDIDELFAKNQEIGKEIDNIQSQCKHENQKLKQVPERLDSTITVIRWVCGDCKKTLRIPTEEETKDYLKQ